MFALKNKRETLVSEPSHNGKTGVVFVGVSILVHFVFLLSLLAVQHFEVPEDKMPPAVQVDLVSYSPDFSSSPALETAKESGPAEIKEKTPSQPDKVSTEKPAEPAEKEPVKTPQVIKPDVSLKSKPENLEKLLAEKKAEKEETKEKEPEKAQKKTSLKKKTYEPEKVIEAARDKIEKSVEKQSDDRLQAALDRLAKKVEGQKKGEGKDSEGKGSKGLGGNTAVSIYNSMIAVAVQQNWVFNQRLARIEQDENNPTVTVVIKILKSGKIADIWIETRSGNRYLDQSAVRAVKKASPLPPLPEGYTSYDVGLRFTPRGVKGS
ncbi:MAG: TonB family protein [Desulfarculaceae bacterium]|nr:TonB family protein [Desulfarculaceae bacterium]